MRNGPQPSAWAASCRACACGTTARGGKRGWLVHRDEVLGLARTYGLLSGMADTEQADEAPADSRIPTGTTGETGTTGTAADGSDGEYEAGEL